MPRNALILVLALLAALLAALPGERPAVAQPELDLGFVVTKVSGGYASFVLPVANSALARDWAAKSGLAWQAGFNYSTAPVQVSIEHRQPLARSVRVSVTTSYGYATEELALSGQPPAETPQTTVSREILVPPSVPANMVLLPRVCPPSQPGAMLKLRATVEIDGQLWGSQDVELIQLEPAHVYSLWLDGPTSHFFPEVLNDGNRLDLAPPLNRQGRPAFETDVLSSRHYLIGVDRRDMTFAPLAARDFAFVLADLTQVAGWPAEEQQALLTFMLGGGHLCLFNAAGSWRGLDLARGARPLGRGVLLPVDGGLEPARNAIRRWLEGELEEFTLWVGGTSGGWQARGLLNAASLTDRLEVIRLLAPTEDESGIISHRAGFLHPVWIYREACRGGALEPWDYPEFNTTERDLSASNRNLRRLDEDALDNLQPLPHCVVEARRWPSGLTLLVLGLPLALLAGGAIVRLRWLPALLLVLALAGAGWLWVKARPLLTPPLSVTVVDAELGVDAAVARGAVAGRTDRRGDLRLPLPSEVMLRRVSWPQAGDWTLTADRHGATWHGEQGGPLLTLATEGPTAPPQLLVEAEVRRLDDTSLQLTLDTRGLVGGECYLLTPLGWLVLPAGQEALRLELQLPRITNWPGRERLSAWEAALAGWLPQAPRSPSIVDRRSDELLHHLATIDRSAGLAAGLPRACRAADRLAWLGLVQNPLGLRGALSGQFVLLAPLGAELNAAAGAPQALGYSRLTFPLEPPP